MVDFSYKMFLLFGCSLATATARAGDVTATGPEAFQEPLEQPSESAPSVNLRASLYLLGKGSPLAGVQVMVDELVATTGEDGSFEIRGLSEGVHLVRLADPSLEMSPLTVETRDGELLDLELWAFARDESRDLLGTYRRSRSQVISRSLSDEEIRSTPGTLGDPIRALQNVPGVVRTPLDAGWLLVRGGAPEDTGCFLDGIQLPLLFHFLGVNSVIHPALVGRVDFYPGGYDVRYGRATAGVLDMNSRPIQPGTRQVQAGADLVDASVFMQVPIGQKGGFAAALRRSYLDGVLSAVASQGWLGLSEGSQDIAPRFWDWQARLDRPHFSVMALGYTDMLDAPLFDSSQLMELRMGTQRLHARGDMPLGNRRLEVSGHLAVDWQNLDQDTYKERWQQLLAGTRLEIPDTGTGELGWWAGLDVESGNYTVNTETMADAQAIGAEALFASFDPYLDLRLGDDPSITVGSRLETLFVSQQLLRAMPSPRIRFNASVTDWLLLRTSSGVYHQWPPLKETVALPAGPYLELERAYSGDIGAIAHWSRFSFEADLFGRKLENVTMEEDDGTLAQARGLAYGAETWTRWASGNWKGWISYTYSRSLRQEEPGELYEPHVYDQPHYLVMVASWELPRQWTVAGRFRYGSGFPRDPEINYAYDILLQHNRCLADTSLNADTGACPDAESERLQAFHSLDLKFSRRFLFHHWVLDAYLDIWNIYNRRVAEPVITGSIQVNSTYSFGLPILPVIGVKAIFNP